MFEFCFEISERGKLIAGRIVMTAVWKESTIPNLDQILFKNVVLHDDKEFAQVIRLGHSVILEMGQDCVIGVVLKVCFEGQSVVVPFGQIDKLSVAVIFVVDNGQERVLERDQIIMASEVPVVAHFEDYFRG